MKFFKKKEQYVPLVGITGVGEDYNVYILSKKERIIGFLIGFGAGFFAMYSMFRVPLASLVLGAIIGIAAVPIYRKHLQKKRKKAILLQFRDLLDSLSNSFSSGKNTPDAFADAYHDLTLSYTQDDPIVKETSIILNGLHNNYVIEDLLRDMAKRCELDDVNSFAETFAVCNRLGGNLKRIVAESRDIITEKIEIEMEIETTVASNKNEINMMSVMPFVIVMMMQLLGQDAITENSPINVIVKIIALGMFVLSYIIGRKITDIKV